MRTLVFTIFLVFTSHFVLSQTDSSKLIFGDWYMDGGRTLNLDINEQAKFSRYNNDSLYLKWSFQEDNQFIRSGVFKSPDKDYPIGFKSKPVKYRFIDGKSVIYITSNRFKIVNLNDSTLILRRFE